MASRSRSKIIGCRHAIAILGLTCALATSGAACGARSGLPIPGAGAVPRSSKFCARGDYDGGFTTLDIYLVLDKSASMADDMKWDEVSSAISAFADDPEVAGIGLGVQYFPLGFDVCDDQSFVVPAVAIAPLPGNASKVKASLAAQVPDGSTPTLPALRGAIEYARAARLGDPTSRVLVALATDGAPDECDSTTEALANVAGQGASADPQVLTFVIGLETGYLAALAKIAAAGGTGAPIVIGKDDTTAQKFVDALKSVRDAAQSCKFALPPIGDAVAEPSDLEVTYGLQNAAQSGALLVQSATACPVGESAFYVDDPSHPTEVILCPDTCAKVHGIPNSRVTVIAGCGDGETTHVPPPADGGKVCPSTVDFSCVSKCGASDFTSPDCVGGELVCLDGRVSTSDCDTCPPVPHGCCKPDGTLTVASCVSGAWVCPPGAPIFGDGMCKPPAVCAPTLPCGANQLCRYPDFACGASAAAGACVAIPAMCTDPPQSTCGCDHAIHTNACDANSAGVDIARSGCEAPAGTFPCGPLFCEVSGQICRKTSDLTKAVGPDSYACLAMPPACPTGCGCKLCEPCPKGEKCVELCTKPDGGALLTCSEI